MSNVGTIGQAYKQASKIALNRHKIIIGKKYQNNLHLLVLHQTIQGSEMCINYN